MEGIPDSQLFVLLLLRSSPSQLFQNKSIFPGSRQFGRDDDGSGCCGAGEGDGNTLALLLLLLLTVGAMRLDDNANNDCADRLMWSLEFGVGGVNNEEEALGKCRRAVIAPWRFFLLLLSPPTLITAWLGDGNEGAFRFLCCCCRELLLPLFNDLTEEGTLMSLTTVDDDVGRCCCCCVFFFVFVDNNGAEVNAVAEKTSPSASDPLDGQFLLFSLGSIVVEVANQQRSIGSIGDSSRVDGERWEVASKFEK